jgi:arabinoxylan arabinofuranohydrolase
MSKKMRAMGAFVPGVLLFVTICFADNPLVQTNYTPDPAPMVYNDTVFLYTGHDEDSATGFTMFNYLLYTSSDLVNWRDRGIVVSLRNFSWAPSNGAWASQCIYRNGKFYYYCAIQLNGIGVLVADSPYGPFTDPLGHPLIANGEIDPTVFIDDDGQAYLFFGNPTCRYVKLNQDMISYSGSVVSLPALSTYQEGPWFYKRNGHYYLAWSSTCCPEGIGYAMATAATGPWTYRGSIMDGNTNSSGNQPGIFDFKGSSYTTGFSNELWFSIQGGRSIRYERRSACLTSITYNADGTIPKVPWWGVGNPVPSVPQVGTFNPYDTVQAETMCWSLGVRTQVCNEGGINVDSIHNGDLIKMKGVNFGTGGAGSFIARVASATSGGNIELRLDNLGSAYEAEAAALSGTAVVATDHTGYTGTGFVAGFINSTTAQVLFTVTAPSAGQYSVQLRYSAGNGASSNTGLFVNGTQTATLSCPATASWDTWSTVTNTVTLNAGSNTIAYRAVTSSNACINLDNITIPSIGGSLVGTCAVAGTGGWQTWATRTCTVTGATGVHDLYLMFTGGTGLLFNFNWWKFNPTTGIGSSIEKNTGYGNSLKIRTCSGTTTSLQLDFSQPVSQGNLKVCLFDLTGRLVTTLYKGRLSSPHLTLPLSRAEIRTGTYLISITLNDKIALSKTIVF